MAPSAISATSIASSHSNGTTVNSAPTRGTCANGSRSSTHCGNPANEPIRYNATKAISTPHATGVNLGARPNNPTVTAANSQTAGNCTAAAPTTVATLPPTSPAAAP